VVEVLLSAIKPRELVTGKVLGIGAVALVQGTFVAAAALITSAVTGANVFEGASQLTILWAIVWFILGYGFYSWANAALGSTVSRQADAQNAAFPVGVPLIVGYISATTLLSGGDPSPFIRVLSFLPPTAPMIMPMLIGIDKVELWQVAVSIAISIVTIVLLSRAAAAIYSRAILHTGQRLKLRQVIKPDFTGS
jgi:ABC-2 type transport system permease protein